MAPPRKRQEYKEREPDDSGTPLQRFEQALKKIIAKPKEAAEARNGDKKRRASA